MRLHRLIGILLLIESRGTIKASELAEALETSKRTIYRDIDTLCEAGIPLYTTTGPNGGISFSEGYSINLNQLYGDEVINLYFTGIGMHPKDQRETQVKLKNALLKLENSLPFEYKKDINKAKQRFYYDDTPWWGEIKKINNLEIIRKSVWQQTALFITYLKYDKQISNRIIYPYGLVVKQLDWYLVAYDKKSDEVRIFKCERISNITILEENYEISEDFSLESFWNKTSIYFKQIRQEEEFYPVLVKLMKDKDFILQSLDVMKTEMIDNSLYATINMHTFNYACDEALEIAGFCEIKQPLELRDYVKNQLLIMIHKYMS